jgi:PAS domain S-box-containing protein
VNTAERTAARYSATRRYAIAALIAAAAVGVCLAFGPILGRRSPFLIFPIAILLAARFGGRLPGLAATLLTALGGWYFLTNPPFSLAVKDKAYAQDLVLYVISATGISLLEGQLRESLISKQRFVSLADTSLQLIGMWDLDARPRYLNPGGMRLVGLDDLKGVRLKHFFFPEEWPFIKLELIPRVLRDSRTNFDIRLRHFKTGEPIWVFCDIFRIFDTRGIHMGWATVSVDVTQRKRAEEALRESRQELRALAGSLINAQEQERKRISRELHDDLSQELACLALDISGLLTMPLSSEDKIREQLLHLRTRIVELSQHVREISHRLHPSILDDLGLTAALNHLCEDFSAREGIKVQFTSEAVPRAIPVEVAACLYRVAQEAMHNVLKHAQTGYVQMKLSGGSGGIHLSIQDTGVGFDSESLRRPGLGIVSMKERVRLVHGEFSIHSKPGQGTEVRVFVPLPKESLCAA